MLYKQSEVSQKNITSLCEEIKRTRLLKNTNRGSAQANCK